MERELQTLVRPVMRWAEKIVEHRNPKLMRAWCGDLSVKLEPLFLRVSERKDPHITDLFRQLLERCYVHYVGGNVIGLGFIKYLKPEDIHVRTRRLCVPIYRMRDGAMETEVFKQALFVCDHLDDACGLALMGAELERLALPAPKTLRAMRIK